MSGNPLIPKYPLDWTGVNPVNLVTGEHHTLGASTNRAFVTNNGPFFVESVRVFSINTGLELRRHDQFVVMQPEQEAALRYGKDIASVIYVKDQTVGTEILIDYQVLGGEYSYLTRAIRDLLNSVNLDNRPVAWLDIIGRPSAYNPSPHLHDLGDTFGWEYIGMQLEGIAMAILMGDRGSHDELRQWFLYLLDQLQAQLQGIIDQLGDHIQDRDNPHQTTKAHVGLGNVENYPPATEQEAIEGTRSDRYLTPLSGRQVAEGAIEQLVKPHIDNKENPHETNKGHVGLGNVDNFLTATELAARQGTRNDMFMTPLRTAQAIDTLALVPLNTHIQDRNNPHGTTAAQVGAYSIAQTNDLLNQRLSLADGGTVLSQTVFRKDAQTNGASSAVQLASTSGDVILSLSADGESAALVRHVRGSEGVRVTNNAGSLAPVAASNIGTMADRDLFVGTTEPLPSLGEPGDVYFRYEP